jgi:hypothetical protein
VLSYNRLSQVEELIMTQEDQYAIIGKAHEDYKSAKLKMAAIESRGHQISTAARNLSEAILDPTRIIVLKEGESGLVAGIRNPLMFGPPMAEQLSQDYVRKHVEDFRSTKQQLAALRQQLLNLGQGDPEAK